MRILRSLFFAILCIFVSSNLAGQQPAPSVANSAAPILQKALAALVGGHPVSDVTLTGTARRIAGSDDESGSVTVKALAIGRRELDLSLASGALSEMHDPASGSGKWKSADGALHDVAYHNVIAEPLWYSPAILLSQLAADNQSIVTDVGPETRNGQSVEHLSVMKAPTGSSNADRLLQQLSKFDLYLDSQTLLPASIAFTIHPDNDANTNIPIEVRYSGYRSVSGVATPFHLEKFLNNGLVLDLQFQNATLNSGLTAASFTISQ